ncbi:MAG TPA: hypothetical protein VGQ83_14200 [Polyangia bacterium]
MPEVTVHGLRGTWATLTTDAGVAAHIVARELGHTTPTTTKLHYTQAGAADRAGARRMLTVIEGGLTSRQLVRIDEDSHTRAVFDPQTHERGPASLQDPSCFCGAEGDRTLGL